MLRVPIGSNADAFDRLRRGEQLRITIPTDVLRFSLDGADEALSAVRECVGVVN
jgi:hypothetical protein